MEECNGVDDDCDGTTDDAPCDDGNPCTGDECGVTGCAHAPQSGSACDDSDPCTTLDACNAGECVGAPTHCADGDPCTLGTCAPNGTCITAPGAGPCSDGNACTQGDYCSASGCQAGSAVNCFDDDGCTIDSCDPSTGCIHMDDSAPCFDGDICTASDVCLGGVCAAGPALVCDDADPCTTEACSPSTGCTHAKIVGCGVGPLKPPGVAPLCAVPGIGVLFPLVEGVTSLDGVQLLSLRDASLGQTWIGMLRVVTGNEVRYQLLTGDGCKVGPDRAIGALASGGAPFGVVELPLGGFAMNDAEGLRGFDLYGSEIWRDDLPDDHGTGGFAMVATGPASTLALEGKGTPPVSLNDGSYAQFAGAEPNSPALVRFGNAGPPSVSVTQAQ